MEPSVAVLIGCIVFTVLDICICCFCGIINPMCTEMGNAWTGDIESWEVTKYGRIMALLQIPLILSIIAMWLCYVFIVNEIIFWLIATIPMVSVSIASISYAVWFDNKF